MSRPLGYRAVSILACNLLLALVVSPSLSRADDDDDKKKNNNESQQSTSKNKKDRNDNGDDDAAPDLKLAGGTLFVNAAGQVNERVMAFTVTNVGTADAPATTARVEITNSGPASEKILPIPVLKRGGGEFEGFADLPTDCDGHVVKISANVIGEISLSNNTVGPLKLCPEKPKAPQGPTVGQTLEQARQQGTTISFPDPTGGIAGTLSEGRDATVRTDPTPEHLRPGAHTLTLGAAGSRGFQKLHRTGNFYLCDDPGGPSELRVGFNRTNFTDANNCQYNWVYQTALRFDLSDLREGHGKLILGRAMLTWDDRRTADGDLYVIIVRQDAPDEPDPSCVTELGKPTQDWSSMNDFVPHDGYLEGSMGNRWNVTNVALDWLRDPAAERLGVLLKGPDESLDAEDSSDKCYSQISNPRLVVDYTVLP